MFKIGELSKLCKIPVKTLRYYDSEGLLVPDEIDKFTGYRYYSAARLADCNKIIALKELGFTLNEIKKRMNAGSSYDVLMLINAKQEELKNIALKTELQLRRLETVKHIITEGENIMFDVTIRNTDTMRVATLRKIYKSKEEALEEIKKMKAVLPKNILGKREAIINYETEYRESDFDFTACTEIIGKLPKESGYTEKIISLPSDTAVLVCKKGELEEAYREMTRQLEEMSCQVIGSYYEIYYDDSTVELKVPVCKLSTIADKHKNNDIDLPFENDENAVGKWEFLDVVPSEEQFCYGYEKSNQGVWLDELYFLPNGEWYWAVAGWTKGWLYTSSDCPNRIYKNKYKIKTIDGKKLMFIEMKDYNYESRGGMPSVWVYEKISDNAFSRNDLRVRDNTDMPFVPDEKVLGKWIVRDFVLEVEDFDTGKHNFDKEHLYFIKAEFKPDGTVIATLDKNQNKSYTHYWTKGFFLDKINETASAYSFKKIAGKDYLFIQWKSGDYIFGGRKPYWYIFVREK